MVTFKSEFYEVKGWTGKKQVDKYQGVTKQEY